MIEIFLMLALVLLIVTMLLLFGTTSDTVGYIKASGTKYFLFLNGSTDGNETEIKLYEDGGGTKSLGEALEGKTLEEIALQVSDGSILTTCKVYEGQGTTKLSFVGNERTARDLLWNLRVQNLQVPITRSMTMKINCGD